MTDSDMHVLTFAGTAEALNFFDKLEPVNIDFMLGAWHGSSVPSGHALDGVLEAYHWHGKRFETQDNVHPLVFTTRDGRKVSLNPALIPFAGLMDRIAIPRAKVVAHLFQRCMPLLTTGKSRARLRMTEYRGKLSATMIYDDLPINDVFRKLDEESVLGMMDYKGMKKPYFFTLRRE